MVNIVVLVGDSMEADMQHVMDKHHKVGMPNKRFCVD